MQTPRPCKRLPAEPSSDRQAGKEGEDKHAGTRIPTMWEDAVYARAPPQEDPQPTRKRKLEPSPQSTTHVYPRQSRERQSHEAPGMFPQVRTRHTPTAQRTRTDPTGQPFLQVTGSPTQRRVAPTATQRTHHHAKSNLGDEKRKGASLISHSRQRARHSCLRERRYKRGRTPTPPCTVTRGPVFSHDDTRHEESGHSPRAGLERPAQAPSSTCSRDIPARGLKLLLLVGAVDNLGRT